MAIESVLVSPSPLSSLEEDVADESACAEAAGLWSAASFVLPHPIAPHANMVDSIQTNHFFPVLIILLFMIYSFLAYGKNTSESNLSGLLSVYQKKKTCSTGNPCRDFQLPVLCGFHFLPDCQIRMECRFPPVFWLSRRSASFHGILESFGRRYFRCQIRIAGKSEYW